MSIKQAFLAMPSFDLENFYDNLTVIGIDEAGRGPIAGPVVAACILIDKDNFPNGIDDSKKISAKKRKVIFEEIKISAKYGVGIVDEKTIDDINILQATKLAMLKSYKNFIQKYQIKPQIILVDGNFKPFDLHDEIKNILPVVKGDQKSISIAAASIIAKETRDEIMLKNHQEFPQYGFDKHVGYPTKLHVEKLKEFGISKIHRKTFSPVKSI